MAAVEHKRNKAAETGDGQQVCTCGWKGSQVASHARTEKLKAPVVVQTRESWLHAAIEALRPRFDEIGMPLPKLIHVSVGFGGKSRAESANVLGTCWASRVSDDGANHLFISPELDDTAKVLACLLHELIHAADDCKSGHKGAFAEAATRLGFEGSLLTLNPSMDLTLDMITLAETLGDYPHSALNAYAPKPAAVPVDPSGNPLPEAPTSSGPKTQGTRMLKLQCASHDCECGGYVVRTTAKWLAVGYPSCPAGSLMELA